jgi:hypothetical protein
MFQVRIGHLIAAACIAAAIVGKTKADIVAAPSAAR